MKYILDNKLSAKGGVVHKNAKIDTAISSEGYDARQPGECLTLFNTLKHRDEVIKNVTQKYHNDMVLFGYGVTLYNGQYYATCSDGDTPC